MPSPPDGTVSVCIGQCRIPAWADATHLARGMALLPCALHPEITRYHRLEDRLARLTARLLLRKSLLFLGLDRESTLATWRREPEGRPFLADSDADVSISHANPWVVAGVGVNCRIGIDVETFRPLELDTLTPYLTPAERQRIAQAPSPDEEALRCWSLREAILKADGRGLLAPESLIRDIGTARTAAGAAWQIQTLELDGGCLTLACDRQARVQQKKWEFTELLGE